MEVVAVSKPNISATVDEDVHEFLQQDHINISGLVNRCLREYMNTGGDVSAVRDLRIQQLEDDAADLQNRAENKRERAEELRAAIESSEQAREEERLERALDRLEMVPANPENGFIIEQAEDLEITPEELAREVAEEYNKEYQDPDDDSDLRSI